jgi:hypothetical protein
LLSLKLNFPGLGVLQGHWEQQQKKKNEKKLPETVPLQSREGKKLSHWDTTCGYFGHQAQKLYHIKNYACSFAPIYFYFC